MIGQIIVGNFLLGHTVNALVKKTKNNKIRSSCAKFIFNFTELCRVKFAIIKKIAKMKEANMKSFN